jgi:hypothetical protein
MIKQCNFYVNDSSLIIAIGNDEKKYVKEYNSTYKLHYNEMDYKIQIQDFLAKENGYYLYTFYCYNYGEDNFDSGLNIGLINYGKQNCFSAIL